MIKKVWIPQSQQVSSGQTRDGRGRDMGVPASPVPSRSSRLASRDQAEIRRFRCASARDRRHAVHICSYAGRTGADAAEISSSAAELFKLAARFRRIKEEPDADSNWDTKTSAVPTTRCSSKPAAKLDADGSSSRYKRRRRWKSSSVYHYPRYSSTGSISSRFRRCREHPVTAKSRPK